MQLYVEEGVEIRQSDDNLMIALKDVVDQDLLSIIDEAVGFIHNKIDGGVKVMVYCHEGRSRSVAVAVAYLMRHGKKSMNDAYGMVQAVRSKAKMNMVSSEPNVGCVTASETDASLSSSR